MKINMNSAESWKFRKSPHLCKSRLLQIQGGAELASYFSGRPDFAELASYFSGPVPPPPSISTGDLGKTRRPQRAEDIF